PFHSVASGSPPAAVAEHLPAGAVSSAAGVDGQDHALRTEHLGAPGDQVRVVEGRGVDRHLVGAMGQELCHVLHAAHTTADCERDEHLVGGTGNDIEQDVPVI